MPFPRRARYVDVALGASMGLVGVIVLCYVRMPDFQRAVQTIAGEIEDRFFHGDVAGAMNKDEPAAPKR
jgi:hypothetical protein